MITKTECGKHFSFRRAVICFVLFFEWLKYSQVVYSEGIVNSFISAVTNSWERSCSLFYHLYLLRCHWWIWMFRISFCLPCWFIMFFLCLFKSYPFPKVKHSLSKVPQMYKQMDRNLKSQERQSIFKHQLSTVSQLTIKGSTIMI